MDDIVYKLLFVVFIAYAGYNLGGYWRIWKQRRKEGRPFGGAFINNIELLHIQFHRGTSRNYVKRQIAAEVEKQNHALIITGVFYLAALIAAAHYTKSSQPLIVTVIATTYIFLLFVTALIQMVTVWQGELHAKFPEHANNPQYSYPYFLHNAVFGAEAILLVASVLALFFF